MKKQKKLVLAKETVLNLSALRVAGGEVDTCWDTCNCCTCQCPTSPAVCPRPSAGLVGCVEEAN